ncbi:ATP-binding protein [Streptomyces sp. NPDC090054]|uniref:ATP-binding protein n=1 Tax=Streptomyces sp. NPDC090054 TaxID=3365933 RepID=UPI0037F8D610
MSLPLTRRIARTALLLAAGTAPVVGAAGVAAAAGLESVPQLGALTAPDSAGATAAATDATGAVTGAVPTTGPAGELAGTATKTLGGLPVGALRGRPGPGGAPRRGGSRPARPWHGPGGRGARPPGPSGRSKVLPGPVRDSARSLSRGA